MSVPAEPRSPGRIAVVGCGALGGYYGGRLRLAGHDVHFLLRSDYEVVRAQGLHVRSPAGDFHVHPACARTPMEIGPADLVVVGLKTTANDQLRVLLPPLIGPATRVLTLQNGLGNEERLAAVVGADRVLGGLCFVCLNRIRPGWIEHLAHGLVVLGELGRPASGRTRALGEVFRGAGIPCQVTDDLARAHWEKLVWNIPFNGLGVAAVAGYDAVVRGSPSPGGVPGAVRATDGLLGDPRWEALVRELMSEVIAVGRALGHAIDPALAETQVERTRRMGSYKASTLIDFERGQPLELESLFLEPLREARRAGVEAPRLDALCRILRSLDPGSAAESYPAA